VIARTSQVKDDLVGVHGFPGERIDVIPYAVDVRQFASGARGWLRPHLGIPNDAHVVSFVGRLVREKGLALAMAAIRAAPNAHLVAVGGGDPATFVDDARRAGVADRVHFLPYTDRPQDILADSDVFAFPSAQDVWGIPVIEAMAASVPVLCSDAAGASNAVRAADAGVVTPPDNEAFARALRDLLASPHLRSRLGRNGAAAAQAYAPDRHAQATLHCYGDAIERRLRAAEGVERASLRRAITALRGLS
jgi:glycosyltransferase involved in cell wall biosynthesis